MKLGLFMMPTHPPDKPTVQCYDEDVELIRLADELGFSEAFIGEHATMAWENIPAPDQFIARVFPETRQIRLGTGVVLMPYHHPANTANRIAQLDHLTRGRINFGIGISGVATDLELFGVDPSDGRPGMMMMRAHALIEKGGNPTDREIRRHMQTNLCRCGTHMRILRAVRRALNQRKSASTAL